jgi:hypothetical protein
MSVAICIVVQRVVVGAPAHRLVRHPEAAEDVGVEVVLAEE